MKKIITILFILTLALVACTPATEEAPAADSNAAPGLTVGDKTYTVADLEALSATEATFREVTYKGVAVTTLLEDAGYSLDDMSALKAIAVDGYSANYEPAQIQKDDVIVAYALADGPLTDDDGAFRMVLPEEEGNMNVRMLAELEVIE